MQHAYDLLVVLDVEPKKAYSHPRARTRRFFVVLR